MNHEQRIKQLKKQLKDRDLALHHLCLALNDREKEVAKLRHMMDSFQALLSKMRHPIEPAREDIDLSDDWS